METSGYSLLFDGTGIPFFDGIVACYLDFSPVSIGSAPFYLDREGEFIQYSVKQSGRYLAFELVDNAGTLMGIPIPP